VKFEETPPKILGLLELAVYGKRQSGREGQGAMCDARVSATVTLQWLGLHGEAYTFKVLHNAPSRDLQHIFGRTFRITSKHASLAS
jgi:hypothetical protein